MAMDHCYAALSLDFLDLLDYSLKVFFGVASFGLHFLCIGNSGLLIWALTELQKRD